MYAHSWSTHLLACRSCFCSQSCIGVNTCLANSLFRLAAKLNLCLWCSILPTSPQPSQISSADPIPINPVINWLHYYGIQTVLFRASIIESLILTVVNHCSDSKTFLICLPYQTALFQSLPDLFSLTCCFCKIKLILLKSTSSFLSPCLSISYTTTLWSQHPYWSRNSAMGKLSSKLCKNENSDISNIFTKIK